MSDKVEGIAFKLGDKMYTFFYTDDIKKLEKDILDCQYRLSTVSHGGIIAEACANANISNYEITQERAAQLYEEGCSISFNNVRAECVVTGYYDAVKMLQLHDELTEEVLINAWRCLTAGCNNNIELDGDKYRNGNLVDSIRGFEYTELESVMKDFIEYYNMEVSCDEVLSRAVLLSWLFERISPFSDGNARMSRLLIYDFCVRHGCYFITDYPITKTLLEVKKEYKAALCNNPITSNSNDYVRFMLDVIYKTVN